MHHWELATLYNRPEHKKNRIFLMIKSSGETFAIVNSVRMIYLKRSRDNLINWKLGWLWIGKSGCEVGWGSRVWGMWMWCKEDWINLLSLQCAFIPNGSDMSTAQHSTALPSVTLHRLGKDARKEQEGGTEVDGARHKKERQLQRERERETVGESGSNHLSKNNHNPQKMQTYYFTGMLS